jgi:hypothetical protein
MEMSDAIVDDPFEHESRPYISGSFLFGFVYSLLVRVTAFVLEDWGRVLSP